MSTEAESPEVQDNLQNSQGRTSPSFYTVKEVKGCQLTSTNVTNVDCECWLQDSLKEPRSEPAMTTSRGAQPYEKPSSGCGIGLAVQNTLFGAQMARLPDAV